MPDDDYGVQEQQTPKKKKQEEPKVAFEMDKVFAGKGSELDDIESDLSKFALDASRYRASHGQAGTRTQYSGPSSNPERYESTTERVE